MTKTGKLLAFSYACSVIFSLVGLFVISGKHLAESNPNNNFTADFNAYYRNGKMVLSKDRTRIYDRDVQLEYFNAMGAAQATSEYQFSQNPPFFFVLMAPFALMPLNLSFKIWIALSVASACVSIAVLMKGLHNTSPLSACVYVLAALSSAPGWICFSVGQMSWFLTCLAALFFFGCLKRKDLLAGLALALTTTKFQYVFVFGVPLLAQRRWRLILWAAAAELALLILSAAFVGMENVIGYPAALFEADTTKDYSGVFPEYMISIRGILSSFFDRRLTLILNVVIMLLGAIPLFALWYAEKKHHSKPGFCWAIAITICAALLLSPHTHIYDDTMLVIAAAATLPLFWKDEGDSDRINYGLAGAVWKAAILALPFLSWAICIASSFYGDLRKMPFAFFNALLLICAIIAFRTAVKHSQSAAKSVST